jgi:hypothetical protein
MHISRERNPNTHDDVFLMYCAAIIPARRLNDNAAIAVYICDAYAGTVNKAHLSQLEPPRRRAAIFWNHLTRQNKCLVSRVCSSVILSLSGEVIFILRQA